MRYVGPVYRPQRVRQSVDPGTVDVPTIMQFCMVYKRGPRYRVRPVARFARISKRRRVFGDTIRNAVLSGRHSIAMPTEAAGGHLRPCPRAFPALDESRLRIVRAISMKKDGRPSPPPEAG